jgi:beta-ribofuranosylaminobenzene 5'-phosphate synthase
MIRIETGSRLHFGLLSPDATAPSLAPADANACVSRRRFGGVGLMVELPGIRLSIQKADRWQASGPLAERALAFALRFASAVKVTGTKGHPCHLVVEQASPEHAGLGTGTQLGMAVGRSLAAMWGFDMPVTAIACHVGRGERSAVGIHGFEQGGLVVEGGKTADGAISPLVARFAFPDKWRIVLIRAAGAMGTHGLEERQAMANLASPAGDASELCRRVLLEMLPALVEQNLDAFGDALFEFNAKAGEVFAPAQGGVYSSPAVACLIAALRSRGVRAVGQSSWGPIVFAIVGGEDEARDLAGTIRTMTDSGSDVSVTRAINRGATLTGPLGLRWI